MTVEEFADRLIRSLTEWQIASREASRYMGEKDDFVAEALFLVAKAVKEAAKEAQEDNDVSQPKARRLA